MLIQIKSAIPPLGADEKEPPLLVSDPEFKARKLGNLWVYEPHAPGATTMSIPSQLLNSRSEDISACCHVEEKWDPIMGASVIVCSVQGKPLKPYYVSYGMHGKPYSAMFSLSYPFAVICCNSFMKITINKLFPTIDMDSMTAYVTSEEIFSGRGIINSVYCKQHGVILSVGDGEDELDEHLASEHINTPWRPNHDIVISEFEGIPSTYQFAVRAAVRSTILNVSHHAVRPFYSRSTNEEYKGVQEEE